MEDIFTDSYEKRFDLAVRKIEDTINTGKKSLNISGLGLKTIPVGVFKIHDLKELNLSQNQIRDIPNEIADLKELNSLSIQRCQLLEIPKPVLLLKKLTSLNLSRNKIEVIPDDISNLTLLKTLTLAKNKIKNIPSSIGLLERLSILELRGNQISKLPKEMSNLKNLTRITLVGNPINFPHSKQLKGILPSQNALFQILHHFIYEGAYDLKSEPVTSRIKLPKALRMAFQQYLTFFNDFLERTKGSNVRLQIAQYEDGIELSFSNSLEVTTIQKYLDEYIGFLKQEVDKINPSYEKEASHSNQQIFLVELKNQIRHLTGQLELKRVENSLLEKQVQMFHQLLVLGKENPHPIHISTQSYSHSSATSNVSIDFRAELQDLQHNFFNVKNELSPFLNRSEVSELETIDKALLDIDDSLIKAEEIDKSSFKRIKRLIEQINNPDSNWNKAILATKKGMSYVQKLGKQYNKFAPWLGMPSLPQQLL